MLRIIKGSVATLRTSFIVDGSATEADAAVSVTIKSQDGTVVDSGNAAFDAASTSYSYVVGTPTTDTLGYLLVEWSGSFSGAAATVRDDYEVVGGRLASVAEVRNIEGLSDTQMFPDESVQEAIVYAEDLIADYCGTMFVARAGSVDFISRAQDFILTPEVFPTEVLSATANDDPLDVSDWGVREWGEIETDSLLPFGQRIKVSYVHGLTPTPSGIRWAARTIARQYLLDLVSRIPDRALSIQSDFGQVQMAQAGGRPDRPTSMPDVNAALNRHRHRVGGFA